MKNLRQVTSKIMDKGGVSFNPNFMDNEGHFIEAKGKKYMVATKGNGKCLTVYIGCFEDGEFQNALANFIKDKSELLLSPSKFVGIWIMDGVIFFDISEVIEDVYEAILLGYTNRQIAIYDLENDKDINLPKNQSAGTDYQKLAYQKDVAKRYKNNGRFYV